MSIYNVKTDASNQGYEAFNKFSEDMRNNASQYTRKEFKSVIEKINTCKTLKPELKTQLIDEVKMFQAQYLERPTNGYRM